MIGDRVRQLRERRGWSQGHLAEAAGVSARTIQRVEADHAYSGETAMALAAALDVPVSSLVSPSAAAEGEHRPLWPAPAPKKAAWAALGLTLPGALFIGLNTINQAGVNSGIYDFFANLLARLGLTSFLLSIWPVPLIVMPVLAFSLVAISLLRLHGRVEGQALSVTGFEVRWHPLAALAAAIAVATAFAPLANITAETIRSAAQASSD